MKPKTTTRPWPVRIEYTVRGTVIVEAETAEEAREAAREEMTCPGSCSIVDWDAREEKP